MGDSPICNMNEDEQSFFQQSGMGIEMYRELLNRSLVVRGC